MWQELIDVPEGKIVTSITNPFSYGKFIWAEVIVNSPIPDIMVFANNIEDLENSIEIPLICDESTKCQICRKSTDKTTNVKIQYNYQDWIEYSHLCRYCTLEFSNELLDDNNDVSGFQVLHNQ